MLLHNNSSIARPFRLLAAFILFATASGYAQTTSGKYEWKQASAGGYTYRYVANDPTNSRFYTLKNGLTVILSPSPKQPRIQTYIAVKAGSKTDPSNHTGLAHYLEHLMFKGTDRYGSLDWSKEKPLLDKIDSLYEQYNSTKDDTRRKDIYKEIDQVSGQAAKFAIANEYDKMMSSMGAQGTNAFTSFEETVYTEDIPSSAVDKFLTLQGERFRMPVFRIFHTELEAVYEEKNRGLDNDSRKVFEAMFAAMFPNNNYGRQTTIGTVEHLKNPSLKAIRQYYNTYYVPNNMGIIMSGDFNPDVMIKKIDEHFSWMQQKPVPPYTFDPEKPITSPVVREVYGPTPENIMIGYRFPGASTEDAQMLNLVSEIITNGKAGLFDLDLTKKQKLLTAGAFAYTLRDYSTLLLQGNPIKGQSLDEVKNLMLSEIDKLKKGEFDNDLIVSIVNNLKKSTLEDNQNYNSRAGNLMDAFTTGVDWSTKVATEDKLSKITKQQIVDFANKYLGDNYVIIYKRQGEDKNIVKVEKPPITPVEVNRDAQSPFLKSVLAMPSNPVKPVWLDYSKDIQRSAEGKAEVLAVKNKENSIFKLYYKYNTGSWSDKLLPVAAQYIQFLGTANRTAEDISKQFYKLAASFNISVSGETTIVSITGLQENFAQTVKLYEDLIANCKPDAKALAGLKERLKKGRENAKLNKGAIMQGLVAYAQYGPENPFNNVLSDAELDALTPEKLVSVLHNFTGYKHTIMYYGPETAQQIAADLKPVHNVPAVFKSLPAAKTFKKTNQDKNKVLFADYDMVQAEVQWVRNTDIYAPERTPEIELFNSYYGGNMSSIVFQTIRESKALAYSTYASYNTPYKKGDRYGMVAYVGTQADKFNDALAGMNDLLTNLPESEKVFSLAKESIRKSLETDRITDENIFNSYISAQQKGLNYDIRKNTYDKVNSLTFADIKRFFDAEIKAKPYTYCVVASEKKVSDDDLKKYGELTKLKLDQIFGY